MSGETSKLEKWRMWTIGNSGLLMPIMTLIITIGAVQRIESIKQREAIRAEFDKTKIQELMKTISMIEDYSFNKTQVLESQAWNQKFFKTMKDEEERFNELKQVDADFMKVLKQTQKLQMILPDKELSEDITNYLHKHALYAVCNAAYVSEGVMSIGERSKGLAQYSDALETARKKMMLQVQKLVNQ